MFFKFQGQLALAKTTLRQALELTNGMDLQFWQFRLTFQLAVRNYTLNMVILFTFFFAIKSVFNKDLL